MKHLLRCTVLALAGQALVPTVVGTPVLLWPLLVLLGGLMGGLYTLSLTLVGERHLPRIDGHDRDAVGVDQVPDLGRSRVAATDPDDAERLEPRAARDGRVAVRQRLGERDRLGLVQ